MSELRNDLVTGRLVLLAAVRSARPHSVALAPAEPATDNCPFCPGNEHETPPEVVRTGPGEPNTPDWRIRVVPNLYPIVGGPHPGPGGRGTHEVVIIDADHRHNLGNMADATVVELFRVLRDRARVHAEAGYAHVQVLVNHGRAAGASIAHPHAQVVAVEFVPPAVHDAVHRFEAAHTDVVVADADAAEQQDCRVLSSPVVAWCPWAAASPFETRIAARDAGAHFEEAGDDLVDGVASATKKIVAAIDSVLSDVAFNVVVHNAPAQGDYEYHWYVTVAPRLSTLAGFELGTGVFVNTVEPASAAALLREAVGGA